MKHQTKRSRQRQRSAQQQQSRQHHGETAEGKSTPRPVRAYELQQREVALLNLLRSYPNLVLHGLAKQPEAGWHFGRLYLVGVITQEQYDAAVYLDKVTRKYESLLRRYGHVGASSFEKVDNLSLEDLSLSAQKTFLRAKRKYEKAYDTLTQCGGNVKASIEAALRLDENADLTAIQRGLTVLATGLFTGGGQSR